MNWLERSDVQNWQTKLSKKKPKYTSEILQIKDRIKKTNENLLIFL